MREELEMWPTTVTIKWDTFTLLLYSHLTVNRLRLNSEYN